MASTCTAVHREIEEDARHGYVGEAALKENYTVNGNTVL
jgi:hypothetical protein